MTLIFCVNSSMHRVTWAQIRSQDKIDYLLKLICK